MKSQESEEQNRTAHDLIVQSLHGDRNAFRRLVESHHRYAFALAFRLLRDEERSKDVVQESFIQVWKHLEKYRHEIKFTTWLYRIVVHRCYDSMKMERRQHTIGGLFAGARDPEEIPDLRDPVKEFENADLCSRILDAAKQLPPKERLVFLLRDVQDFSVAEVADYAGISAGAVKTNLYYARKRIRAYVVQLQKSGRS